MAWRSGGSLSRSLMSAARSPSFRSSAPLPRFRPPTAAAPRIQSRRLSFAPTRSQNREYLMSSDIRMRVLPVKVLMSGNLGALGCAQSFLPIYSMAATAHLNANVRAFCELSHGTFCRTCQDR
ncbi:hypothetical protein Tsubulata_013176 [Turnera subulata]|uniref:Uncharacterized protein n=1 Tax=Turnera subulata TaxID=218843 RepID=A0A9Q0JCC9_9ROSI|nr:hypothetical protein Tsubulata_013176 [Turnera subulata]